MSFPSACPEAPTPGSHYITNGKCAYNNIKHTLALAQAYFSWVLRDSISAVRVCICWAWAAMVLVCAVIKFLISSSSLWTELVATTDSLVGEEAGGVEVWKN